MECTDVYDEFFDDPALEGGSTLRQPGDPTENDIWGYTDKDGQRIPGLTQEVRTQGFLLLKKSPDVERAEMTPEEQAAEDADVKTLAEAGVPDFQPGWTEEIFRTRLRHVHGDLPRHRADEEFVELKEYDSSDIFAGMN